MLATDIDGRGPLLAGSAGMVFGDPYEQGGVTVIPAAATRTHSAGRDDQARKPWPGLPAAMSGKRPVGALVVSEGSVRWRPLLDVTRLLTTAEIVAGAVVIADRLSRRPTAARANVTMGPGGWVSMKGGAMAVRRSRRAWRRQRLPGATRRRPLWARLLSARTLQSLLG